MPDSGSIGELFVSLGIKGSDKTLGTLDGMKKGLKDTASMGLEAKVAIIGAVYAMERLFASSGKVGTDLTNFNASLGVSAKTLQQYQYAARQVGVSNQEIEGTFKALQNTVTQTLLGKGQPEGLARVSQLTGGMTTQDLERYSRKPEELIQKLQEYAQKETHAGLRNKVLKDFGIGDGMAAALRRGAFTPKVLNQAPTYSDSEIKNLDKANIAWANLGNKIEMAVGRFNAKHGGDVVKDITMITDSVLKLAEAFVKLAEKTELIKWVGKAFEGWAMILDEITNLLTEANGPEGGATGAVKREPSLLYDPNAADAADTAQKAFNDSWDYGSKVIGEMFQGKSPVSSSDLLKVLGFRPGSSAPQQSPTLQLGPAAARPSAPSLPPGSAPAQTFNIDQNLNFGADIKEPQQISSPMKKAVRDAFRQISAQGQGS